MHKVRLTRRDAMIGTLATAAAPGATLAQLPTPTGPTAPAAVRSPAMARSLQRRAVEAGIWGMPTVNYQLMLQECLRHGGSTNRFVYWGRALDWHNQTLTPNPDAIYFMAFFDMREAGPLVLEVPPGDVTGSLNGNLVTAWQAAIEDVGLLGVDRGTGGRFVILPPGHDGTVPPGHTALPCDTKAGYMLLRSNMSSHAEADVAAAIAYGKRARLYPLSAGPAAADPNFLDLKDVLFDSTIRYDASFFEHLNRVVQNEDWIARDRAMIDPLRTLGIEKGKPFAPDAATRALFNAAMQEVRLLLEERYDAGFPPFWPSSHWTMPTLPEAIEGQGTNYADVGKYAIDARAVAYSYAYIALRRLGTGQFYLISIRDRDGNAFDGRSTYRLVVPPNVPVEQYWSVTAYDRQTHTLIRDMPRASRSSQIPEMQKNADGTIEIFFGPAAPPGREANWVPTDPQRPFELMFRLYAPTRAFFEKQWVLPDIIRV